LFELLFENSKQKLDLEKEKQSGKKNMESGLSPTGQAH
jgi:hypothetical protein